MAERKEYVDVNLNGQSLTQVGTVYFGNPATDGSFRMTIVSGVLVIEKRISGSWENMGTFG